MSTFNEILVLTYGAFVGRLIKDMDDVEAINIAIEKFGYNIGRRIIDDYLCKTNIDRCNSHQDTANHCVAALKMYLGIEAGVKDWTQDGKEFSLVFANNPLAEYVELPPMLSNLAYSNVLCGAIRGSLAMISIECESWFIKDVVKGETENEIRVKIINIASEMLLDDES